MTVEALNDLNEDLISIQEDLANLKNEIDKPGEVVYLNGPKKGKKEKQNNNVDSIPDMTNDEIMKLPKSILYNILNRKYTYHKDKLGQYVIINGKKVYDINIGYTNKNEEYIIENKAFIYRFKSSVYIIKKINEDYIGVSLDTEPVDDSKDRIYKGKFNRWKGEVGQVYFDEINQ